MRKIILSRKGFDSAAGGYPSPIMPDGTMLSFPIPEDVEGVGCYYSDLNHNGLNYLELMKQLGVKTCDANTRVHLDPDISREVIKRKHQEWSPIFGQCSSSASHLDNHNVNVGDIFLFFGWFRNTIKTTDGYKYDLSDKYGKHIIWGYFEVGEGIKITKEDDYPVHYLNHPHFEGKDRPNNTAYIAAEKLCFDSNKSGAGTFKFNESLVLSNDTI